MQELKNPQFQKSLLLFNGIIPALLLLSDWYLGKFTNPPEAIIRTTGVIAILFLVLTLAVTPAVKFLGWGWAGRHRRWLGLFCFYYALAHLLAYSVFDQGLALASIFADIAKRPFILIGFSAFLLLLPLALTSTNAMIKRLGKRWKTLHLLAYPICVLTAVHYWWVMKSDFFYPALVASAFALLLAYRIAQKIRRGKTRA